MRLVTPTCLLAVLALAACGGDDSMSTDEYRAAAKRICVDAEKASNAVERPQRTTTESIADYLERLLAANERTIDRFAKLDPPEDLQRAHDDVLKVNRDGAKQVRDIVGELEGGGDAAEVLQSSTGPLRDLNRRSNAAAEKLGVPECVQ